MPANENAKVLIVDDEPIMINFLTAALGEQGYQLESAVNGREALEKTASFVPDVILMDVVMPELTGFEVTERLKSDPATAGIPIILITGLGLVEDRVKGLEAGADDFLNKPFNLEELLARVRSLAKLKKLQDRLRALEQEHLAGSEPPRSEDRKTPEILVVEDDERVARLCATALGIGGYMVATAKDGPEALEKIEENLPDLIVLDLMLPGMDGLELLARLKQTSLVSDIPVLILTALGDLKTKVKGLYLGADDYVVKPVSSLELLARVRANLRKHALERRLKGHIDKGTNESGY